MDAPVGAAVPPLPQDTIAKKFPTPSPEVGKTLAPLTLLQHQPSQLQQYQQLQQQQPLQQHQP